jgi:type II secretion system protein I
MTLIEVLVALGILAGVIGSLLVLMGQHTRQTASLDDRMLARIEAENALALYVANRNLGRPADIEGENERAGRVFRYELDRSPSPIRGFEVVTSDVRLRDGRQVLASFSTLAPVAARREGEP